MKKRLAFEIGFETEREREDPNVQSPTRFVLRNNLYQFLLERAPLMNLTEIFILNPLCFLFYNN